MSAAAIAASPLRRKKKKKQLSRLGIASAEAWRVPGERGGRLVVDFISAM